MTKLSRNIAKIFVLMCILVVGTPLFAQQTGKLTGTVTDALTGMPVSGANVKITAAADSSVVITDSAGIFRIGGWNGRLEIQASSIGYQTKRLNLEKVPDEELVIMLKPNATQLKEVAIRASKPLVRREIDRLIYQVQSDPENRSLNALEMMAKVPMLSLDAQDNIRLKGSGNYRVFVNGRPSALMAQNPAAALRAMPSSSVLRIEVITNPPAKYDAEGLAGIINVVLRQQTLNGYNGTIGMSFNDKVGFGENVSGNTKFGRFGMTMTGLTYQDIRRNLTSRTERSTFGTNANNLLQQGIYSYVGEYTAANVAMSYEIDSLQLLGSNLNLFKSWYGDRTSKIAALYDGVGQLQQYHEFTDVNPQHQSGVGFDINYQLGFKNHRERLFTLSYQYSNTPNRDRNDVLITNAYNYGQSNYIQQNANGTNEQTAQADYVHPFKKAVFEGGIKAIFRHNFSDYERSVETAGSYVPEPLLSDHFDYHQRVMSLYSSLQLQFTAIEIKAGIRLEHTSLDGNFSAAQTRINQDYYNFIPVVSLQRKLGASIVNLGYAQRILRPGIYQINPYINNSDPLFVSTGNPDLRPVVNRSVELSYTGSRKGNYNISVVYSFANNSVQKLTDVRDGISYTSYQNIGKNRNLGLNASISFAFSKRLNASLNTQLSYLWIDGNINGLRVTNNGIEGYAYGTIGYKLAETWRANSSVSFNSSSVLLQGGTNGRVNNTYRLTKELFKKKLQLAASVSNPWARYRYNRTTTVGDAFSQLVTGQKDYRMYMINLNYNFGQLKGQVKKNKRKIDNDDRLAN